jgi:hypothetical protein
VFAETPQPKTLLRLVNGIWEAVQVAPPQPASAVPVAPATKSAEKPPKRAFMRRARSRAWDDENLPDFKVLYLERSIHDIIARWPNRFANPHAVYKYASRRGIKKYAPREGATIVPVSKAPDPSKTAAFIAARPPKHPLPSYIKPVPREAPIIPRVEVEPMEPLRSEPITREQAYRPLDLGEIEMVRKRMETYAIPLLARELHRAPSVIMDAVVNLAPNRFGRSKPLIEREVCFDEKASPMTRYRNGAE